jgi:alkylation response protein AidB-like acyl-CoA dehydrogenase
MRLNALRMLRSAGSGTAGAEASIAKLFWAQWHRALGELAIDIEGLDGLIAAAAPYELTEAQRLFLFSRADTIYGGSDEIQRTIIAERALGLPREPRAEIR